MNLVVRRISRIALWTVAVFILLWVLIWTYVFFNKKRLIGEVNTTLTSRVRGSITIEDLEPSLLSTFPNVSLQLSNTLIRDTLYSQHHHDLLQAKKILIKLRLWSLFSGSPEITKVIIENGSAYIFSDTLGHTNEYMLKPKNANGGGGTEKTKVPDIVLRNFRLTMELQDRYKFYDFEVGRLSCDMEDEEKQLTMTVNTNLLVHQLTFNSTKGSFLKEKPLDGNFKLYFNKETKDLSFNNIKLKIDEHPFALTGKFGLASDPPLYYLSINTKRINYKQAARLVSENIGSKLDSFEVEKPIDVIAIIDGSTLPNRLPLIDIDVDVSRNKVNTVIGEFSDVSCKAHFNNQLDKTKPRLDNNSGFTFSQFEGKLENIPLTSKKIAIENLDHPEMHCDIHADFPLERLNEMMSGSTIEVSDGSCKADLVYKGLLIPGDSSSASVTGSIVIKNGAIKYLPRNLKLSNVNGSIVLDGKDVLVKQLSAKSGSTALLMNGEIRNFTSLVDKSPEKLLLYWNVQSPHLDLGDFISFVGKRSGAPVKVSKKKTLRVFNQVDKMLQECNVDLKISAQKLQYKKFDALKVIAQAKLTDQYVALQNVQLQHEGGTVSFNGMLRQLPTYNSFEFNANMTNLNIKKIFSDFNNFKQDGITDKNLEGRLSATTKITGNITDKADLVTNSLKGTVDILLQDGQLKKFEPLEKISQTALKNRNFSDIRFADLKEKMDINGSEIKLSRMEIQSTVMSMFVEGIYDLDKGTDLSIQVPISNLSKRDEKAELKNKGVNSKAGLSVFLRAKTAADGKTKITWDPFKRALKKTRTSTDSTEVKPL